MKYAVSVDSYFGTSWLTGRACEPITTELPTHYSGVILDAMGADPNVIPVYGGIHYQTDGTILHSWHVPNSRERHVIAFTPTA